MNSPQLLYVPWLRGFLDYATYPDTSLTFLPLDNGKSCSSHYPGFDDYRSLVIMQVELEAGSDSMRDTLGPATGPLFRLSSVFRAA